MAVYTGLILQAENPNELQGVMAHEIGHLAGGHSFRSGDMMKAGLKPMLLTIDGRVPPGAGVSSSSALVVASFLAFAQVRAPAAIRCRRAAL